MHLLGNHMLGSSSLYQRMANFFCKGPGSSKYIWLVDHAISVMTAQLCSCRQCINKWTVFQQSIRKSGRAKFCLQAKYIFGLRFCLFLGSMTSNIQGSPEYHALQSEVCPTFVNVKKYIILPKNDTRIATSL